MKIVTVLGWLFTGLLILAACLAVIRVASAIAPAIQHEVQQEESLR